MLAGSLQPSKKSTEWRRTLIRSSFRVTWDRSGAPWLAFRAEAPSGCLAERLRFSRLHLVDCLSFLFFRAFLLICWVKEFLEGMAGMDRNKAEIRKRSLGKDRNTEGWTWTQNILLIINPELISDKERRQRLEE